jgi:hypothetical protein
MPPINTTMYPSHSCRSHSDHADQIREVLLHAHYLSQKDIEICAACDLAAKFETHANFIGIDSLHQTLRATYTERETAVAT